MKTTKKVADGAAVVAVRAARKLGAYESVVMSTLKLNGESLSGATEAQMELLSTATELDRSIAQMCKDARYIARQFTEMVDTVEGNGAAVCWMPSMPSIASLHEQQLVFEANMHSFWSLFRVTQGTSLMKAAKEAFNAHAATARAAKLAAEAAE